MDADKLEININKYIKYLESERKSDYTIKTYKYHLYNMLNYINNNYDDKFDIRIALLSYVDNISNSYEPPTVNLIRSSIRGFITYLYSRGHIKEDFSGNITFLKIDTKPKIVLEPKDIVDIFQFLLSELKKAEGYSVYFKARNLTLFAFLLYSGVRRKEATKVKWRDIDFINDEMTIIGKGNKTRLVPLLPDLKQQLYSFRDILESMDKAGFNVKSEYLFRSEVRDKVTKEKNKPMIGKNVERIIKDIVKKAKIEKDISPHNMRHTFASYAIKNKMNLPSLSEILGHANLSTTLNIYGHEISIEEKKKEMGKIKFDID